MSFSDLSQTRRRAWLTVLIWGVAGAGVVASFFSGGGPAGFADDSGRILTAAVFLAFGFLVFWGVLWMTREKAEDPPLRDERDLLVMARANQATLMVVLVWVFVLTIGLWVAYDASNQVPSGWLWFTAYSSVVLAFVTSSTITLVLDGRSGGGSDGRLDGHE